MPINKNEVRIMIQDIGYTETSKRLNIKRDTLYQWAKRYGWNQPITHSQETVRTVRQPSDVLAEYERETRLSLAKSARRMAKDAEECTLRDADKALKVGQLAGIVHKWNDGKANESFSLNVLNMGALEVRVGKESAQDDQMLPE